MLRPTKRVSYITFKKVIKESVIIIMPDNEGRKKIPQLLLRSFFVKEEEQTTTNNNNKANIAVKDIKINRGIVMKNASS